MGNRIKRNASIVKGCALILICAQFFVMASPFAQADINMNDLITQTGIMDGLNQATNEALNQAQNAGMLALLAGLVGFSSGIVGDGDDSLTGQLEERYHINKESAQSYGENMNVSETKGNAPEVQLFFTPNDPKVGQEISAKAVPMYFSNAPKNLYFTWYLQRKGCEEGSSKKECDKDGDGNVDVNDWKVEAMRTIAQGGFVPCQQYDANSREYKDCMGSGPGGLYNTDTDKDGYTAPFGGGDKTANGDNYCYIHNFDNGKNYELSSGGSWFETYKDKKESLERNSIIKSLIDAYKEAHLGDTSHAALSVKTADIVTDLRNAYPDAHGGSAPPSDYPSNEEIQVERDLRVELNKGYNPLYSPTNAEIQHKRDELSKANGVIDKNNSGDCASRGGDFVLGDTFNQCKSKDLGGASDKDKAASKCEHLFPRAVVDGKFVNAGSGGFNADEERFWGTDPKDSSTAQNGNKDEANVVGLGQDTLKWNYRAGDKVGVVVEGTSMFPTKHSDASKMIMWALPKNKCKVQGIGTYAQEIKGYNVTIDRASMNIDDCLDENLVDPTEGGQPGNLEVTTSFSPENPTASVAKGDNAALGGNTVNIQTFVNNSTADPSSIHYDWKIFSGISQDTDGGSWTPITETLRKSKNIANSQGTGLSELSINLNVNDGVLKFKDGQGYLKVQVEASEYFQSDNENHRSRIGRSTAIIKITDGSQILHVSTVKADPDLATGLMHVAVGDKELCLDTSGRVLCPVIPGQIVALSLNSSEYTSFAWTLNGQSLSCGPGVSSQCDTASQGKINFFPVTGNVGETYNATLTASNLTTGKTITLNRQFVITEPFLAITSGDENKAWSKYLGQYTDLDGVATDSYSGKIMQGLSGEDITLKPVFVPDFLNDPDGIYGGVVSLRWLLNGDEIAAADDGSLSFALVKNADEIDSVSLEAVYTRDNFIRKALRDIWGVSEADSDQINLDTSVQIEMVLSESEDEALGKPLTKKFFASLASYIPSSVIFAVRLFLTMALVLFVSGLTLSLAPDRRRA